jgi:hypothetical protein
MQSHGPWDSTHVAGIRGADAVLVISGAEGAEIAGYNAIVLEKPMLPVGSVKGASNTLWKDYKRVYQLILDPAVQNRLFHVWDSDSAKDVVPALKKLCKDNPFFLSGVPQRFSFTLVTCCFIFWIRLFSLAPGYVRDFWLSLPMAIFLSIIAASFGVCLRAALAYKFDYYSRMSLDGLLSELVISAINTFSLVLFFGFHSEFCACFG